MSDQIAALMGVAREESDYLSEQFVQWFLKEQVEEVATMSSLLAVVRRSRRHAGLHRGLPGARGRRRGRRSDRASRGRRGASR